MIFDEPIWDWLPWSKLRRENRYLKQELYLTDKDNETLRTRIHQLESELGYANSRGVPKTPRQRKGRITKKTPNQTS